MYLSVVELITEPEDVRLLTYEIARDLVGQQVRYAEVTVTPSTLTANGIPAAAVCEAIEDARVTAERDLGIVLRWCFDIPGELGVPAADETLAIALEQRPDGLVSFGLGGPEDGVPRPRFAPHFDAARAAGLRSVPHAGETTGPGTVWNALQHLGAERIGHGIAAVHDPDLVAHLVEHGVPLEVCPTSNVRTGAVASLAEHPLPHLIAAGVTVSINSDDPPMFDTTLNDEYAVAAGLLDLDAAGVVDLAIAAVDASFPHDKARVRSEIADHLAPHR